MSYVSWFIKPGWSSCTRVNRSSEKLCFVCHGFCAGFGWGRVNFLYSSWYGVMLWYCAENNTDDTGMFLLLLRSVYTEPRPFPLLTLLMRRLGMHKKLEERTKRPKGYSAQGILHTIWHQVCWKKGKEDVQSEGICIPKPPSCVMKMSFPGKGWILDYPWEVVNEFPVLLWFTACFYFPHKSFSVSSHEFFHFSCSLPHPA